MFIALKRFGLMATMTQISLLASFLYDTPLITSISSCVFGVKGFQNSLLVSRGYKFTIFHIERFKNFLMYLIWPKLIVPFFQSHYLDSMEIFKISKVFHFKFMWQEFFHFIFILISLLKRNSHPHMKWRKHYMTIDFINM